MVSCIYDMARNCSSDSNKTQVNKKSIEPPPLQQSNKYRKRMPSASAKIEKTASIEAADPIKQFHLVLEKKVRNLEKRKLKLDNYRNDVLNGKELNEDQKLAVNKYEQVVDMLEYSKELCKSLTQVSVETLRIQKKLAKKEQIERQHCEIQRLQEALYYKHMLSCFEKDDTRNDFLDGGNGAVKLSPEDLHCLDQLYKLLEPNLPSEQSDVESHFHVLAENLIFLVEGKNKEVAGTTYKTLKDLLQLVKDSGYFSKPSETNEEVYSDDAPELDEAVLMEPPHIPFMADVPKIEEEEANFEKDTAVIEEPVPEIVNGGIELVADPEKIEDSDDTFAAQNGSLQDVLVEGNFNFLQESQIELDTPHMDPAVVAVHQLPPPSALNFSMAPYPVSPPAAVVEESRLASSVDPQSVTNRVPLAPRTISTVQHNSSPEFDPNHPIPTQTFTNQNFTVMHPNMIMPPTYVPVTMHHVSMTPHIAPIAVVPGISPPVSSPGSAMPIHVTVASVPVSNNTTTIHPPGEHTNGILEDGESEHLSMNGNTPGNDSCQQNGLQGSKTGDGEGYNGNGYQRNYRGGRGRGRSNGYYRGRGYNNRGNYQNHNNYYQGNFRRGAPRGNVRGNGNNRGGRGMGYRMQPQQQQPQHQPQQQTQQNQ